MTTVIALALGLGAVIFSSTLSGLSVVLLAVLAAYMMSKATQGPLKTLGRIIGIILLCLAALAAAVIAFVVVCTSGLLIYSAVAH